MLQDRAAFFGLDKTADFEDFKSKYLKAAENVASQATQATTNNSIVSLDINNYSDVFTSKKAERDNTQKLVDYVNNLQGADSNVLELYNSIGKIDKFNQNGIKFSVSHSKNHAVSTLYRPSTNDITEVKLIIPKLAGDNLAGQVGTTLHEEMHLIDLMLRSDPKKNGSNFASSFKPLIDAFNNTTSSIGKNIASIFSDHDKEINALDARLNKNIMMLLIMQNVCLYLMDFMQRVRILILI